MRVRISLEVNSEPREVEVDTRASLALLLRDGLGLTGTHVGCGTGSCGACTVQLDGRTVKSCCVPAPEIDGRRVRTVEGLAPTPDSLHPVQAAFAEQQGLQCGFCTPGMIMSVVDLLERNSDPTEQETRFALAGNLCRCTGYANIFRSVRAAAEVIRSQPPALDDDHVTEEKDLAS